MKERIKKLRKQLELTQVVFAERIGMKQNSIALIESGKRNISDYALRVICREFNVNEEWLRYGQGKMFKPSPSSELEALANKYNLSDETKIFIEEFISLKPEYQGAVIQFIVNLADKLKDNEHAATTEPENSNSVAAAEALYERSLGIVPKAKSTASDTTVNTEETNNKVYKISNQ